MVIKSEAQQDTLQNLRGSVAVYAIYYSAIKTALTHKLSRVFRCASGSSRIMEVSDRPNPNLAELF